MLKENTATGTNYQSGNASLLVMAKNCKQKPQKSPKITSTKLENYFASWLFQNIITSRDEFWYLLLVL